MLQLLSRRDWREELIEFSKDPLEAGHSRGGVFRFGYFAGRGNGMLRRYGRDVRVWHEAKALR